MAELRVQPIENWYATTVAGDVALCDPFSGEPLCGPHISLEPKSPPQAFINDYRLSNGYGFWKGSKYHDVPPLVGMYMTDPTSPNGLGDYAEFCDIAGNFDVIVHSAAQSPRMEHIRRVSGGMGNLIMHNGVWVDQTYLAALSESHNLIVDLNDPSLATDSSRAVQAVRDTVVTQGMDERDPSDPSVAYGVADYTYANVSQWHQAMTAGLVGDRYYAEHGRPMTSMLVVSSHENGDEGRKFVHSGVDPDNFDILFATQEYADHQMTREYAHVLSEGYIDHRYFDGAAY